MCPPLVVSHTGDVATIERNPHFEASAQAIGERAHRESVDDLAKTILLQVIAMRTTAAPLALDAYQDRYNARPAEIFQLFNSGLDALYQQLHAAIENVTRLIASSALPPIAESSLAGLDDYLVGDGSAHALATQWRITRREISLLRWVSTVRNKAVQHRDQNGYIGNRAVVLTDGFALLRKPLGVGASELRKARELLRGLVRRYSIGLDPDVGEVEIVTYLDFVSHSLREISPSEYDQARGVVAEARRHDLIVSQPFLLNLDRALASLIRLVPIDR